MNDYLVFKKKNTELMDLNTIQCGIFRDIDSLCLLLKDELMIRLFVHTDVVTFSF